MKKPETLTAERIDAILPVMEINPDWEKKPKKEKQGLKGTMGMLRTVWPDELMTEDEADYILALREDLSWRALADEVTGDSNQITGMWLEEAALRAKAK